MAEELEGESAKQANSMEDYKEYISHILEELKKPMVLKRQSCEDY